MLKSYGHRPTTSGPLQLIKTIHRTAACARTIEYCVPNTILRTSTRHTQSITLEGNENRTTCLLLTIRGLLSSTSSSRLLDDGRTRFKYCRMTMTTWFAMATCSYTPRSVPTVPKKSESGMLLELYANTDLDSNVRARHGFFFFHGGGVATYKRLLSFGVTKKNSRLCHSTKNGHFDSVR